MLIIRILILVPYYYYIKYEVHDPIMYAILQILNNEKRNRVITAVH